MMGLTGSTGLAGLVLLTELLTRTFGLREGARRTAGWVTRAYRRLKQPWLEQTLHALGPSCLGRSTQALLEDYLRQEARRHTHQLLAARTPGPLLAEKFVSIDPAAEARLSELPGALLLGGHLGFIPYAPCVLRTRNLSARLVLERAVRDQFRRSPLGKLSPRFCAYVDDPRQVILTGGAYAQICAALRGGEVVCLLGDAGHRYAVETTILGHPARFATGPYRLARSLGAPLFTYTLLPEQDLGYTFSLGAQLDTRRSDEALVADYVAWLEAVLTEHASAWSILPWYLSPTAGSVPRIESS